MAAALPSHRFDRMRLARFADGLVVAVAVSLPWSTSATSILVVVWLVVLLPTLRLAELRRELTTAAGLLPVLLLLFGIAGMLWADVALIERWKGLDSFLKLLVIPLLFIQFRRSERADWVFGGYVIACVALLLASYVLVLWPESSFHFSSDFGVLVKNAPTQSGEFVTCIFGLLFLAVESFTRRQWLWLLGFLIVILAMLMNIFFVATGRTALVLILVLLVLFAIKKLSRGGILILFACTIAIGAMAWSSSPYLRGRIVQVWTDFQSYEATDERNSSGERVEFAKKSIAFIREAPIIGHGTGSMHALFIKSAVGQTGAASTATTNPHNQTFAVAIQLGLIGAGVLWAMWIAHLLLFRGSGLVEWIGLVIVVQNIVGSLFNSHLFDFTQGWVYVFGVGVAGGMALKNRAMQKPAAAAP
ncbi:MAG: O-antigen ligase family protein [Rhizobiales bacterium]|nr:O-antigen ligase family protein [Hyphomicrobiales bacterium]